MTSLTGNKERSSVTTRSRKYGMTDASPTKSASFSPETWYRKAYEESRSGNRPAPEGAGSVPGSSGTPSPGSCTSSPGSFSGSPGTVSPGICTGSPGSLGGSPGFGTGSPGSGSGSSPGSDRGIWCENCNARLVELKRQALKLLIPGPFSSKDPSFSALLHDKLQVPNSTRKAWNERDSRCEVCATHLTQLKQEAVHMVLTLEQAASQEQRDASPGSPPPLPNLPSLVGSRNILQGAPREWVHPPATAYHASAGSASASASSASPAPAPSSAFYPGHPKHGPKPSSLGVGNGAERRNGSPGNTGKPGAQQPPHPPSSPSNGNALSSVALQAHQYLEGTWSMPRGNGVTLYPYQISQVITEGCRDGLTEAALNRYNADRPPQHSLPAPHTAPATTAPPSGTSAAASFFARAAQKLNLSSKKKKQRPTPPSMSDPPLFPTNFSGILQTASPPAPPCLLRAVNKVKDTPGLGKVKVMLRVCPLSPADTSESRSFLKVDPRKKQVTIMDPATSGAQNSAQKRGGSSQVPPKMFAFDAVFPHDASQAEVCAGTVAEVIQSVVNGADGCVFCFGHARLGKSYTMIGKDDSMQTMGIIPCAISWLFKLINERKEKTGARFSVRVSAVEVWGKDEVLKDLLSEVATGSLQDGQSPGVYLCEDPICGMQLQNQSELRAPTAEKAAFFLDAAIASRSSSRPDCEEEERRNSHMLFTLHIYQYRMEKSGKGGMSGGRSRLHLIDLGSCVKVLSKTRDSAAGLCLSLSALGNVILALVNGSKHIPYKDSKLTMLLRESLGNMNCRTTMIAHISASPSNFSETLSTIQIASRVLRMKKKKTKQYTSSSSGGESSCEEGRMRRPTQLRTFHSRNVVDSDMPLLHLSSDPDDYSSSEQSCDTVIYVGPNGSALSDKELTDNEGPPEFVPIIPSLHKSKAEQGKPLLPIQQQPQPLPPQLQPGQQAQPVQQLQAVPEEGAKLDKHEKDCLKCNTFAELQERLECIDGSEEVSNFPFEELPANRIAKVEPTQESGAEVRAPKRISNDQQLEEIREVVVEAEIAQSIIESLSQSSARSCDLSTSRSVTGSSNSGAQGAPPQRAKSSPLHSSKESLSASASESKPRPMGSPRLGIASLTKTSEYKPPSSPSQRCKVYTQKGVMPSTPPLSSHSLCRDNGKSSTESLLQPETRTSPVGMSPQVMKRSSSSTSMDGTDTLSEDLPQLPLEDSKSTTTVTVQQPLELNGEDELVFTMVEELTISGVLENGRPTSIISFNSDCSVQALASGSRPVSIISSISEDLECFPITASSPTAAISEINVTNLLPYSRVEGESQSVPSGRSSISSWLSEMNTGSDGEQSCHSFIVKQCYGQGEALAESQLSDLPEGTQGDCLVYAGSAKTPDTESMLPAADTSEIYTGKEWISCKAGTVGTRNTTAATSGTHDDFGSTGKLKGSNHESSRLFSAKLEQLANRTNSLGRSHGGHYDCLSLERADSLTSVGSRTSIGRDSTMPRVGRSLRRGSMSSPTHGPNGNNNIPQSPKASQSKISAVSKLLMTSPKARSLSASSTKTLSFSTKSLPQSVNRSSSLPPNGKNQNQSSWSTQSLSRNRGSGLASKLPLRAVNGRISELLQGTGGSRASHARGGSDSEEKGAVQGGERSVVHTLPSPYSKITAPRRPHRCSSGHASDNSSVLSGELPPAMGKTALFYHSGGSSGYESMIRDSEATGSTSSTQDSMSDNSSSVSGRRSLKNPKKRNNTGSQRRRLIPNLSLDTSSPVRKPIISPGVRWVDGPLRPTQRGLADSFEIKVYEIDDVERLQRRRGMGNKEVVYFSAKLKILEHRQQRISEVRAKYDWLKKELEQTKQHLMLEPGKWTNEFDLQQTFEVDSLEYLEALEFVTERLENRVNFCKAHLMMITCFDVTARRR
ncbi:hypothetical protein MATL_G00206650 [Megalops atlanticus]|uniref:Kinesin motor domain-containing protein n=1 Tax=Megalops atlanticus TaxID=7932 RepID=A0A9D3PKK6_MEGAT|nr:hypothetical protein MATL_G00206650 [Megalops atlanticus]